MLSSAKLLVNGFVLADSCKRKADSTENTWLSGESGKPLSDGKGWERIACVSRL